MSYKNKAMITDFYELTMANGYFCGGMENKMTYFDVFFRSVPDDGGYAIAAGLEQVIDYVKTLHFDASDIEFLRSKNVFDEKFLKYLEDFHFTGDIWSVPEGTPVFPREPVLTVRAPAMEAQILETYILLAMNHQSLIATKAARICKAAQGRVVLEFGARRAQGESAAVVGARAAYIGGCAGSSNVLTDKLYGVPAGGTMAHSWVQMFDTEYDAFATYCRLYPTNAVLLVDTYNTLKSGVPNAIRCFKEILLPQGIQNFGIRLDSGDITYLTKLARKMLDDAGLPQCKITVSNALDEFLIEDLIDQGACIDSFGVGERLITSKSAPVFGFVYKLAATEENGVITPKIKISENVSKITNPQFKKVYRIFENATGKAVADQLCVHDETIDESQPLVLFDPAATWKRKTVTDFTAKELLVPIFKNGELVYDIPDIKEVKRYSMEQRDLLWDEVKRFENPHRYYVDMSEKLWNIKRELLEKNRG